ncbi:MAG: hypothetical protein R3D67_06970 [Hyphomicrobiaceae bacterium]
MPLDPTQATEAWLKRFEAAVGAGNTQAAAALFAPESHWRDLVAFTWHIDTVSGRDGIERQLRTAAQNAAASFPDWWKGPDAAAACRDAGGDAHNRSVDHVRDRR